ncbi:hypothetical protein LLEC1_04070 [Akanthomyces lecanii]|uniref:Peptidase S53 domain-containing protein n=1 Tax=Cordyceps confragosa TaxID=2714763 RepID=A0A179IGC6_CORDF|nr:hypothetical protein LLEC1_04070 [Akanthomyces lecanii]
MKTDLILLSSLVASALGAPLTGDHVVHEKRDSFAAAKYTKRAVDANQKLPVRIALKQKNLDKGDQLLMDVSDPNSANYGNHYSQEQLVELFAPGEDSIKAVKDWLVASGIPSGSIQIPRSKSWVQFETTASQLESVLKTKYHVYTHVTRDSESIGADEYSLPAEIAEHVDFVHPGVAHISSTTKNQNKRSVVPGKHPLKQKATDPALVAAIKADPGATDKCDQVITPACVLELYKIPNGTLHDPSNNLGIFEFYGDQSGYAKEDLDQFWSTYYPRIPKGTYPTNDLIHGGKAPWPQNEADGESDLDFEISWPIIYPQGATLFQVGGSQGLFNQFLDAIDGAYHNYSAYGATGDDPKIDGQHDSTDDGKFKPTNVISFSYGWGEVLGEFPLNYQKRQCDEFMKLGLQGVSLFISSGDDGVAYRGGACLGKKHDIFVPDYPAGCPYLTVVGATTIPKGRSVTDEHPEVVTTSFSPGGGFSNIYKSPDYQKSAVSDYFSKHDPGYKSYTTSDGKIPKTGGIYNRAGRGYPDLAALGDNTAFIIQGSQQTTGGTSESAPLVAAIFTRINEERIAAGKKPLGFVNPAIYQHPEIFNDITEGDQSLGGPNGDSQPSACGNKGFSAVAGWDPVTGLGTPNYEMAVKVLGAL